MCCVCSGPLAFAFVSQQSCQPLWPLLQLPKMCILCSEGEPEPIDISDHVFTMFLPIALHVAVHCSCLFGPILWKLKSSPCEKTDGWMTGWQDVTKSTSHSIVQLSGGNVFGHTVNGDVNFCVLSCLFYLDSVYPAGESQPTGYSTRCSPASNGRCFRCESSCFGSQFQMQ